MTTEPTKLDARELAPGFYIMSDLLAVGPFATADDARAKLDAMPHPMNDEYPPDVISRDDIVDCDYEYVEHLSIADFEVVYADEIAYLRDAYPDLNI